jgi:hypothetical protein
MKATSTSRLTVVTEPQGLDVGVGPLDPSLPITPESADILTPAREVAGRWSRAIAAAGAQRDRLRPLTSRPLAPVFLWTVAAVVALATARAGAPGVAAIGVVGALLALVALHGRLAGRVVTAAAMVPVVFAASAPSIAWILAGALVAGVAATCERQLVVSSQDLQRHLDWCRRREEHAHMLVVLVPEEAARDERALLEAFRLTDSVAIHRHKGRYEVQAVIDDHRLSREGLERRVVQEVGLEAQFGWAAFPKDGYTLEVLRERALSGLDVSVDEELAALGRLEPVQQPA